MIKHKIELPGKQPFHIWNHNGIVKQSGWLVLPEDLRTFTGRNKGKEAGAFIDGMVTMCKLVNNHKP